MVATTRTNMTQERVKIAVHVGHLALEMDHNSVIFAGRKGRISHDAFTTRSPGIACSPKRPRKQSLLWLQIKFKFRLRYKKSLWRESVLTVSCRS